MALKNDYTEYDFEFEELQHTNETIQFQQGLVLWCDEFNVTNDCLTGLIKVLKKFPNAKIDELPNDGRTIKKTPRYTSRLIRQVNPGQYVSGALFARLKILVPGANPGPRYLVTLI